MDIHKKVIDAFTTHQKFTEELQKKLGRDRAIAYTVHLLESKNIEPTFQRICVVAFKLFPESFSFTEFAEYPDSRIVRNCLWHCVHESKGWIRGTDKSHYTLTEKGKEIVSTIIILVQKGMDMASLPLELQSRGVTRKELVTRPRDREINFIEEIRNSKAFQLYSTDKQKITNIDIRKGLGADRYSPPSYLKDKLSQALEAADLAKAHDVKSYLSWIENNWNDIIGD